jgi:hypothetical protein
LSHLGQTQPWWTEPDQSTSIGTNGDVSQQPVGYWPVGGWALLLTGQKSQALSAAAIIGTGAAAQRRTWPFTTADAGELIALRSGWPATAPWAAPLPAVSHFPGQVVVTIAAAMAAMAAVVLLSLTALARRRRRAGAGARTP